MLKAEKKPPETATTYLVRASRTDPAFAKVVTVLLASAIEEDRLSLGNIFSHSKWVLHNAENLASALGFLRENPIAVVICDRNLPPRDWKALLHDTAFLIDPPHFIVSSRLADEYLWAEALNIGAYDVLATPFDGGEVTRVVSLAWLHWKDQFEQRRRFPQALRSTAGRS